MKRFHVHVYVADLAASVGFYSKLFAAAPARLEADYAKWMLDDPRINFAISARGGATGVDHLGFQTDDASELIELKERAQAADLALLDQGSTTCCYARSDKHWITDPQGIAWEHFHTLHDVPVFGQGKTVATAATPFTSAATPSTSASTTPTPAMATPAAAAATGVAPAAASACCAHPATADGAARSGGCAPRAQPAGAAAKSGAACC